MQLMSSFYICLSNICDLVKFSGVRQKWWKLMEILSVSSSLNTSGGARPNTFEKRGKLQRQRKSQSTPLRGEYEEMTKTEKKPIKTFDRGAGGSMWSGEAWRRRNQQYLEPTIKLGPVYIGPVSSHLKEKALAWSSELQSVRRERSRDERTVSSSNPLQVPHIGNGSPASVDSFAISKKSWPTSA